MKFELYKTLEILSNTPVVFRALCNGLSDEWVYRNEGPGTWSVFDIVGHLIHGERTDWIPRVEIILSSGVQKKFTAFDRYAQLEQNKGKTLKELLTQFEFLRWEALKRLQSFSITKKDLLKEAEHPDFGIINLKELLATWAVHDLNHINQASRVIASQYSTEVGPWKNYLKILKT